MAERRAPRKIVIEYEGTDLPPVYVEGAQGMTTPKGFLQVSFFSEYVKARGNLGAKVMETAESAGVTSMRIQAEDPYGLDKGEMRIVRRIEANLILSPPALRDIVSWLQLKLHELEQKDQRPQ